jgi:hypothetical protein
MIEWKHFYSNKSHRENYLKAVEFRNPDWIPCSISIFAAVKMKYGEKLEDIMVKYPFIFGKYKKGLIKFVKVSDHQQPDSSSTDNWGCTWHTVKGGYEGQVVGHPLADWSAIDTYQPPDVNKFTERGRRRWFFERIGMKTMRWKGVLTSGSGERLFDRMYFLRGFENLMMDIARDNPNLPKLIDMLTKHELTLIHKWLDIGVDQIGFHTDIGTQNRLMIHPQKFRKYIKPMFKELFQTCRKANTHVYLSSDGNLLDIVDDLIECGVSVHDPQFRANGLEGIAKHYKGKLCVDLDLDRQLYPFASPEQIKEHIRDSVRTLNSEEGGLMLKAEISDTNISLENIEAICQAFEEYCWPRK